MLITSGAYLKKQNLDNVEQVSRKCGCQIIDLKEGVKRCQFDLFIMEQNLPIAALIQND
jgi:hypothetical protein